MKIVSASIQNSLRYVVSTLKNTNIFNAYVAVPSEKVGSGGGGVGLGLGEQMHEGSWVAAAASPWHQRPAGLSLGPSSSLAPGLSMLELALSEALSGSGTQVQPTGMVT